jgi:AcrR family transcriptional regulator
VPRTGTRTAKTSVRRELIENEIIQHASRLFAERGFAGTSLQDVAEAMGITRPALYYYVKSKDELLARLVTEITQGGAAEIRAIATDDARDARTKLGDIAGLIAGQRASDPARFLLLVRSESELPPELAKANETVKRDTLRMLIEVIEQGMTSGEFRPVEPRTTALAIVGMCNWVAWWSRPGGTRMTDCEKLTYQAGFGNELESEAEPGILPHGRNSPQQPARGLVSELISGTTFTAPRSLNRRTYVFRAMPSVMHGRYRPAEVKTFATPPFTQPPNPNQMRWDPFEIPAGPQDFVDGILTICGNGSPNSQSGTALHVYRATASMTDRRTHWCS